MLITYTSKRLSDLSEEEYRKATIETPTNFGRSNTIDLVGADKNQQIGQTLNDDPVSDIDRIVSNHTNATAENSLGKIGANVVAGAVSNLGIPTLGQGIGAVAGGMLPPTYATVPFLNLGKLKALGGMTQDFRSRKGFGSVSDFVGKRLDGSAAAVSIKGKGRARAAAYAAASIAPGGAYTLFNRETLYGEGNPGSPMALRNDFTAKSTVTTKWDETDEKWIPTKNPLQKALEFRGDKVNVIDFRKGTFADTYRWKPNINLGKVGDVLGAVINDPGVTQDYIKFFFTGPNIKFGDTKSVDDIMTFRASITSLTDTFNPQWNPVQMIGRADPNYHYSGYSRDMNLDFTIYATDRDELKPIWRKLNALVGYTAPTYNPNNIAMEGSWMRFTLGDLYVQQPAIMDSCTINLAGDDVSWEINIENDGTNMQLPLKFNVSISLKLVTDWLPQKGGRFYSLAKQFEADATPIAGNDDWLSDTKTNKSIIEQQQNLQDFDF